MAPRQRLGEAESTGIPTFPLRLLKSLCSHRADEKMSLASSIAKAIWGGVVRGKVKRSRGDGSSCSSSSSSSSREKAATAAVSGTRLRADRRSGEEGGAGCDAATPGGEGVTAASTSREDVADVDDGSPADEQQKQKQQQQQQDKAELPSARSVSFNEVVKVSIPSATWVALEKGLLVIRLVFSHYCCTCRRMHTYVCKHFFPWVWTSSYSCVDHLSCPHIRENQQRTRRAEGRKTMGHLLASDMFQSYVR